MYSFGRIKMSQAVINEKKKTRVEKDSVDLHIDHLDAKV